MSLSHDCTKKTRIAIMFDQKPEHNLLFAVDTTLSMKDIISDVARQYEIDRPEQYVLSIRGPKNSSSSADEITTVTEENLQEISDGTIMHLVRAPDLYVTETMETLSKDKDTINWNKVLKQLHERFLLWPQFVYVYVAKQGHIQLLELLKNGKCSASIPTICYQAGLHFNILMSVRVLFTKYGLPSSKNGLVSWQLMDEQAIMALINGMRQGEVNAQTLECCYDLLDNCIQQLPDKASWIVKEITNDKIFYRLENEVILKTDVDSIKSLQSCLVNLLNTIIRRAKLDGRQREAVCALLDTQARDILRKSIKALREESAEVKNPFLDSLVTLQQNLLCPAAIRAATPFDPSNEPTFVKLIETIVHPPKKPRASVIVDTQSEQSMSSLNLMRSLVTTGELTNRMSNWRFGPAEAAQFKALGFQNETTPYLDFDVAHCGMLAFDCVMYFAHNCPKETEELLSGKTSLEGERMPFVHVCTVVTRLLAGRFRLIDDSARLGTPADESDFFPMVFCEDNPFEKIFCKCVTAFARTWRDMRATVADMDIVSKVFLEQLNFTFTERACRQRLATMMEGLQKNNYSEVLRRRRQRNEEQKKSNFLVQEIRRGMKPRIDQLIVDNRLRHMEKGDNFHLVESAAFFGTRNRESKCLLLRLSPNHKEIYYETCADEKQSWKQSDELDDDKPRISLASIQNVIYGNSCPHASSRKLGAGQASQCISLTVSMPTENGNEKAMSINLCARSKDIFDIWMDGLNFLKKDDARSSLHTRDFEMLLDLEVKVRCLHLPTGLDVSRKPTQHPRPEVLPPEMGH